MLCMCPLLLCRGKGGRNWALTEQCAATRASLPEWGGLPPCPGDGGQIGPSPGCLLSWKEIPISLWPWREAEQSRVPLLRHHAWRGAGVYLGVVTRRLKHLCIGQEGCCK